MVHEMIRTDREYERHLSVNTADVRAGDDYVFYQCQNVVGYHESLQRAMADSGLSEQETSARLCSDFEVALEYGFMGQNFVQSPDGYVLDDGEFDYDSIMLYASDGFGSTECAVGDMYKCPLLRYIRPGDKAAGMQRIPKNVDPSVKDVEWVKRWYPWPGLGGESDARV